MRQAMRFVLAFASWTLASAFVPNSRTLLSTMQAPSGIFPTRLYQSSVQMQEDLYLARASETQGQIRPEIVYILMFNPGNPNEEGVHTTEYPRDSGSEVMIAFESIDECYQFASVLKDDPTIAAEPIPTPAPFDQMEKACWEMGITLQVVPEQA